MSPRRWLHAFERLCAGAYPYGGLRHCPPEIALLPYQLEPALAVLRHGHARLLVADTVGAGKTIEAGLILRELAMTNDGFRALVVVPAGLREQWQAELRKWFRLEAVMADAAWLQTIGRCLPADVNPWSAPGAYVASVDFVKRPEALRPLEDVHWDLVIVDEAHTAAIATDRRAAVDAIASRARRVLLLTATPPGDAAEFTALCRIGAEPDGPVMTSFRRQRTVESRRVRRSVVLPVRITEDERRTHRLLERYTTLIWREARSTGNGRGRLVTTVLRKRALSSTASLRISLQRRLDLLLAGPQPDTERQLLLPLDEEAHDDLVSDELLGCAGLRDADSERRWLEALAAGARAIAGSDSKSRALVRLLKRIGEPAIVFTEYRDTLEQLRSLLRDCDLPAQVLHGGLSASERRVVLAAFERGGTILIATDAASEGLNLQRGCRVVVHYELPWNPSRLLQRAGRVDRIGQHRRVHEVAFVAADTAEALVLVPLLRRAARWLDGESDRGALEFLTESRVAEAVFEGIRPDIPPDPALEPAAAAIDLTLPGVREASRLQNQRHLFARAGCEPRTLATSIPITVLRGSSLQPGVVLVFALKTVAHRHDVLEIGVAAIHLALRIAPWPRRPASLKLRLQSMLPSLLTAASAAVTELGRRQMDGVRPILAEALSRLASRERAIRDVHESAARRLVQAGLFERPARQVRAARQRSTADVAHGGPSQTAAANTELVASAELRALLVVLPR